MTEKELHKLRRTELLEILLYLQKELDSVKAENNALQTQLQQLQQQQKETLYEILQLVQDLHEEKANSPVERKEEAE